MPDAKISALTTASALSGTEVLPIVQSGSTKKVATDDLTVKNVRSNATTGLLQIAGPAAAATRTMTVPDANFTAARTDAAQTFTGTQTVLAAATQDAIALAGRAGGTSSYVMTLTPTTLSANRTVTFPDASITVARTDAAQTFTGNQQFSNSVGVGGAPNVQFEVTSASGGVARISGTGGTIPQLQLSSGGVVTWSFRNNQNGGSDLTIYQDSTERILVASGGDTTIKTGNLVIGTAGKGIDFSATASGSGSMSGELLDDYEWGYFTPNIAGSASAGTGTYAYRIGRYTKVGNRVMFNIMIDWSGHTGTGFLRVIDLPFTSFVSAPYYHGVAVGYADAIATTAGTMIHAFVPNNTTQIYIGEIPTGGGTFAYVAMDAAGTLVLSGQYEV